MKKLTVAVLCIFPVGITQTAHTARENTLSIGYSQSYVKIDDHKLNENPKGFNLKYSHEFDNKLGVFISCTYTHQGYEFYSNNQLVSTGDLDYYSVLIGPAWRYNDALSIHVGLGITHGKSRIGLIHRSKNKLVYIADLQLTLSKSCTIDMSYEYSKLNSFQVGTWIAGMGYNF